MLLPLIMRQWLVTNWHSREMFHFKQLSSNFQAFPTCFYGLLVYMAGQMDGYLGYKVYITNQPVTLDTKISWVLKTENHCAELTHGTFFEIKFWMLHSTYCCSHLTCWGVTLHSHGIGQPRDGRWRTIPRQNKKKKRAVWRIGRTEKRYTWQYVAMVTF